MCWLLELERLSWQFALSFFFFLQWKLKYSEDVCSVSLSTTALCSSQLTYCNVKDLSFWSLYFSKQAVVICINNAIKIQKYFEGWMHLTIMTLMLSVLSWNIFSLSTQSRSIEEFPGLTGMALVKPKLSYWCNQPKLSRATRAASTTTRAVKEYKRKVWDLCWKQQVT